MTIQEYITIMASSVFVLSIASVVMLFSNPKTFNVKWWVKAFGYTNFIIDGAGGIMLVGHTAFGWPLFMAYVGTSFVLTSSAGLLIIFLYVHAAIVPRERRPVI